MNLQNSNKLLLIKERILKNYIFLLGIAKVCLRGIHHHCNKEQMQDYLNEYPFQYNRRSNRVTIIDLLIRKMVNF